MSIHLTCKAQIASLLGKKVTLLAKYSNFADLTYKSQITSLLAKKVTVPVKYSNFANVSSKKSTEGYQSKLELRNIISY